MTCKHCKDKQISLIDNAGANGVDLDMDVTYCDNEACAPAQFCVCECHNINADRGA